MWWLDGAWDRQCPNTQRGPTEGRLRFGEIWQIYVAAHPARWGNLCVWVGDPKDMSRRPCPFGNQPAVENQCPFGAAFGMFHVHNRAVSQSVNQPIGYWQAHGQNVNLTFQSRSLIDTRWYVSRWAWALFVHLRFQKSNECNLELTKDVTDAADQHYFIWPPCLEWVPPKKFASRDQEGNDSDRSIVVSYGNVCAQKK